MSWEACGAVWTLKVKVTSSEKILLLALANEADIDGEVSGGKSRRSQRYLAAQCGWMREETVRVTLTSLISKGLVDRFDMGDGRKQSSYRLLFVKDFNARAKGAVIPPPQLTEGTVIPPPGGGLTVAPSSLLLSLDTQEPLSLPEIQAWVKAAFWPRYPKRVNQSGAVTALHSRKPDRALLAEILAGLERWLKAEAAARAERRWFQSWPNANAWIARERWRDEFTFEAQAATASVCSRCGSAAAGDVSGAAYCRSCTTLVLNGELDGSSP